ncbi:stage III sporulation protein AA [Oikeobacillus pervagus]|uniref:Stage III sporulation protein AA n=1 Tax=Oikeobacillus pervagus TaxID=1325931 RepID=A0AAJ1SYV8_9BACI|nr:stage III sporulation protein AA [Oikeobacillus pervagus]MDQ0213836.1 stage III sporulation protein AA [Oikeobacillus pervagus]
METFYSYLPKSIAEQMILLPSVIKENMEEIRMRILRPLEVIARGRPTFLPYTVTEEDGEHFINKLSHHSFYTLEEELKRGYITIEGGHRVGLAGKVILENGQVKGLRHLSSYNIRVAREKIGISKPLLPYLFETRWMHTMIIGPPQTGKTTLLRDLARLVSTGDDERNIHSQKVGIVDERSEIAGCVNGIPQLTFGPRIDVLDACPKAEGMMMMIRSMSPDVLVVDEIGREEDRKAIMEAVNAGITLIMTTHGESLSEIKKRPLLQDIVQGGMIERYVELHRHEGLEPTATIRNSSGECIQNKASVTL